MHDFGFEVMGNGHFAGGDLVFASAHEAELAAAEGIAVAHAYGRAEDAAGHGAPGVDVAAAGSRIEGGTGGFVGKAFKLRLFGSGGAEDSGTEIAGKGGSVFREPKPGAAGEFGRESGVGDTKNLHPGAQALRIESVDGKGSVTALGAAEAAGEPVTGAPGGVGQSGIHDLHEPGIAGGERHVLRIRASA